MSRYVTEDQLDKIIEKATKLASERTIMAFLSKADKPEKAPRKDQTSSDPIVNVVIEGHPTRKTWTKKMKSENNKAYKAGLKAGDDYVTRLEAGLEAAKVVA
jgi:hypothetical protein